MSDTFYLNEPLLVGLMNELATYGDDLENGTNALVTFLDKHIGCWGGDDIGNQFASNYCGNANTVAYAGKEAGIGMDGTAENMKENGQELSSVDYQNAAWMDAHSQSSG